MTEDVKQIESEEEFQSKEETPKEPSNFSELGVSETLLEALAEKGWTSPTEIQQKSLPFSLEGKDVAGFAQTGTGKTGAFLITFAERFLESRGKESGKSSKRPIALIICPTRELAIQIEEEARTLLEGIKVRTLALYGGASVEPQIAALKKGVDLVVSTPGRLLDLYEQKELKLDEVKLFICDEVDRMFDMGFTKDVESILGKLPEKNVQKLAFSATLDERAEELCSQYLNEPKFISLNAMDVAPESISQNLIICKSTDKIKLLLSLLRKQDPSCAIIFSNTKLVASWLMAKLEKNHLPAQMISGDLPQNKRTRLINEIKEGKVKILIATDVASRGLHISGVTHVYNFDLPDEPANYVHRIGRTARAGAKGESYSFICEDYAHNFEGIKKTLGGNLPEAVHLDPEEIKDVLDEAKGLYGKREKRPEFRRTRDFSAPSYSSSKESSFSRDRSKAPRKPDFKESPRKYESRKPSLKSPSSFKKEAKRPSSFQKKKTSKGILSKVFSLFSSKK